MEKLIIIGGKGTAINAGESIIDAVKNFGQNIELLGYAIDDPLLGESINGIPVVSKLNALKSKYMKYSDVKFLFCLYRPDLMRKRYDLLKRLSIPDNRFFNFIHPTCYVSKSSIFGFGNIILSGCSIHSNVHLGDHNIINSNVVIEHDTVIKNGNFIAAGSIVGSNVQIYNHVFVGLNSAIREDTTIEDESFIGMSSNVVSKRLEEKTTWFGNPAKKSLR